jgi:hypothetical protein
LAVTTFLSTFCVGEANVTPLYACSGIGDLFTCTNKLAFGTLPNIAADGAGEPNKGAVGMFGDILTISRMGGGLGLGLGPLRPFRNTIFSIKLDLVELKSTGQWAGDETSLSREVLVLPGRGSSQKPAVNKGEE